MRRILIDERVLVDDGKTVITVEQAMKWFAWHQLVEAMENHDQASLDRAIEETKSDCPDWEMRVLRKFLELTETDLVI